ncbi:universal stress protein [Parafrankia elaeagni]|uniref:universal stress protein n=1 Tax=Parafrankia elaeagni TaxID=222534 RepID=UPI0003738B13|nr:universal stress protein [Parafrankia elaeagni]
MVAASPRWRASARPGHATDDQEEPPAGGTDAARDDGEAVRGRDDDETVHDDEVGWPDGPGRDIVVGLDGSADSERALHWAVREAVLRGTGVRAVLAWASAGPTQDGSRPPPSTSPEHPRWTAQWILNEAVDRVRADEPYARIVARTVFGPPVRMLLAEADGAEMLVVGARGATPADRMLTGSVSLACLHGAAVPVVIVHGGSAGWEGHRPIVVGVDGSASSRIALAWAVREARLRAARLRVVHVWTPPPPLGDGAGAAGEEMFHAAARALLDDAVRVLRGPAGAGVEAEPVLVRGGVSRELISEAARAQMLVLGARGRGGFAGLVLGSTSSQCVAHAGCPVAVVRGAAGGAAPEGPRVLADRETGRPRTHTPVT